MRMRWSEFKQYVDEHLVYDDPIIDFIDISFPDLEHAISTPSVAVDDDDTMAIF